MLLVFGPVQAYVPNERQRRGRFRQICGHNGQYDPNFTTIPQPEPGTARDDWKPIQGTPFIEGSRGGDDGIRHVLEMVSAAVVPK